MRHPRYCLAHHQYFLQYHQRYSPTWYATHANTSTTLPMLTHQPRHPYCHSLTLACQPRNLDKLATHASTRPTRPKLARHPHKHAAHAAHATHASTPPTPPTLAHHPRKHAIRATRASTPPTLAGIASHFSNSMKITRCLFLQLRKILSDILTDTKRQLGVGKRSLLSRNSLFFIVFTMFTA